MKPLALLLAAAAGLGAAEITTGAILGPGYDNRAFYIRFIPRGVWNKTYTGAQYKPEAQGKLMNIRLAQAIFHDDWMTEQPFDPGKNTDEVIEALDFYRRHGVLMINVSLQGGAAGYEKTVNGIDRQNGYRFGADKGTYVSLWQPDGSLKPTWLDRLDRLLRAADRRGMVVNLVYFYQGQDELFESTRAIHKAATNITDWLIARNHRNIVVDVANEYDLADNRWDFNGYIPQNIIPLIDEVRDRFHQARWSVPVSASSDSRMRYPKALVGQSDIVLLHGNNRSPEVKERRARELAPVERPVLTNEDDNGRETTTASLEAELASCDAFFRYGGGWGYMPWVQAQRFPFRYMPAAEAQVRDAMPERERDMVYFHAVLDHIAGLVLVQKPD